MTTINVDILTQYKGSQAINKAKHDLATLGDSFKRLAGGLAVEELVRRSVDAFNTEDAAIAGLTNSLNNLGVSYTDIAPTINATTDSFVNLGFKTADTMQAITSLTTSLGNPAKALQVLGITADLARYKHAGLGETATTVAKAIAGSSRAFADLGLKIDKTLTPQNAFNKLMDQANAKVKGAAKAYAETGAGALAIFSAKADSAAVRLGKGLMPAIAQLAEFAIKYILPVIKILADNITPIIALTGALYGVSFALKAVGIASALMAGELAINPLFAAVAAATALLVLYAKMKDITTSGTMSGNSVSGTATTSKNFDPLHTYLDPKVQAEYDAKQKTTAIKKVQTAEQIAAAAKKKSEAELAALLKKWNADSLKGANALTQAAKDKLRAERDSLNLKLAGNTVDMQNIEIQAALQKGQTKEVTDVLLLQRAILTGNADQAEVLAQNVLKANNLVMKVDGSITNLDTASNPFADWPALAQSAVDQIKLILAQLTLKPIPLPNMNINNPSSVPGEALGSATYDSWIKGATITPAAPPAEVNITVTHSPDTVVTATQTASSNGSSVTLSRLNPFGQYGLGF
jgi:hypothetical protein